MNMDPEPPTQSHDSKSTRKRRKPTDPTAANNASKRMNTLDQHSTEQTHHGSTAESVNMPPEPLEDILLKKPFHELILNAESLRPAWQTAIEGTPSLQRKTFLTSTNDESPVPVNVLRISESQGHNGDLGLALEASTDMALKRRRGSRYNSVIHLSSLNFRELQAHKPLLKRLVTQPAFKALGIRAIMEHGTGSKKTKAPVKGVVENHEGVRFADVVDKVEEMFLLSALDRNKQWMVVVCLEQWGPNIKKSGWWEVA